MGLQEIVEPRKMRKRGFIFMLVVFGAFMQAGLYAARRESSLDAPLSSWIPSTEAMFRSAAPKKTEVKITEHPIPRLMAEAEDKFRGLLGRQSKTLEAAVEEYRRRYDREPPKGFDGWWKFLQKYDVKIVDEYDGLMEDLAPFMELSGEEIRRRVNQVGHLPSIDLVRLENGKARALNIQKDFIDDEVSARAQGLRRMVEKFQGELPDMDFPVNAKAEGRILVPWEFQKYPNLTHQDSSVGIKVMLGGDFQPDWRGDGNVWESFRRVCHPESQARRLFGSQRMNAENVRPINLLDPSGLGSGPGEDFQFPADVDNKFNFCDHPWAHYQQGHFFSDWRTIPVLYPVFSPAKSDGYGDIRIPSHYYHQSTSAYTYGWDPITQMAKDFDDNELAWENKSNAVFWRGATTGGGNSPPGFSAHYQRHRFVRMTSEMSDDERTVVFADPPNSSDYTYARIPIKKLNQEIMDVAFVQSTGFVNYPGGREALYKYHRFADRVPLSEHWKYKYLVDFDGMGYSGRLFAFLASDSAVIKSTVYKEYFSEYIQPWLHYIPLSQGYQELYNVHTFFNGPTQSMLDAVNSSALYDPTIPRRSEEMDRMLRRIARAGKHWKQTMARKIDMEAYTYRLCLEWARLWADDRDSMNFELPASDENV